MKPILYTENEKDFDTNGIGILSDTVDCSVDAELNGIYELELKYPVAGIHFESIAQRRIILAKVDPVSQLQPFRIYRITKPSNGVVTVYARHLAYDLMGVPVAPFTAENAPTALQRLKDYAATDCPFTFYTDKTTVATMTVAVPSATWGLMGSNKGSILDIYGGEYEFDRWKVKLLNRRGADRGVSIRYGKNLTSLTQDENIANCYTGIYPFWKNTKGELVQLDTKIVAADGNFDYQRILPVDFSSEWTEAPTQEQLLTKAREYIQNNGVGKPNVSWTVEFVALEQTEEYKNTAILERVLLGDTVTAVFPKLGIDVSARAVAARYKPILERYEYVTLGSVKANIANTIVQQGQSIQQKPSKEMTQIISEQLTAAILGATGGAVRFLDNNGDGMPDTLYIADNPDPAKALKVWRFNYEGWGASANGYNGPFVLGATLEDGFLAEFITAGKINSARIDGATLNIIKGATIAGWNIDENSIFKHDGSWEAGTFMCTGSTGYYSIGGSSYINNWVFGAGKKFGVTKEGAVWCSDIHATGGVIAGWTVNEHGMSYGGKALETGGLEDGVSFNGLTLGVALPGDTWEYVRWVEVYRAAIMVGSFEERLQHLEALMGI